MHLVGFIVRKNSVVFTLLTSFVYSLTELHNGMSKVKIMVWVGHFEYNMLYQCIPVINNYILKNIWMFQDTTRHLTASLLWSTSTLTSHTDKNDSLVIIFLGTWNYAYSIVEVTLNSSQSNIRL